MREILFRAKRIDNGKWVIGYITRVKHSDENGKIESYYFNALDELGFVAECVVYAETICQYIGTTNKRGIRIWENDIVKHHVSQTIGTVKWYHGDYMGWCVDDVYDGEQQFTDEMWNKCEVIGNIFDNPELMENKYVL